MSIIKNLEREEAQKCPFCNKWIVPYSLIEEKEIDEDFNVHVSDIYDGQFDIMREGKVKLTFLDVQSVKEFSLKKNIKIGIFFQLQSVIQMEA